MEAFLYSDGGKRYHTYDYYLKHKFGEKIAKIGIDGGFTCPNKDGNKGIGGCHFCGGGGAENCALTRSIAEQYRDGREKVCKKWGKLRTIVYFQSNTSTYAPIERLSLLYEEALALPDVVGISVGTRADCLPTEVLDLLSKLRDRTALTVELGLQTVFDETAEKMNRGHTFDDFLRGYRALKDRGIAVCVHLIDGLPGETQEMMLESARIVGKLRPDFVKIHSLYVRRGTVLERMYREGKYTPMTMGDYLETLASQIELLPPETVVERVTGDALRSELIAPDWTLGKLKIINSLDKMLLSEERMQGICYISTK